MEEHGQEVEGHFGRYLGKMQWLFPYAGLDWRTRGVHMDEHEETLLGQRDTKDGRSVICAGIQYTLPLLFVFDVRFDTDGLFRAQLMREDIPLTPRLRMDLMGNSDLEYMGRFRYILNKTWAVATHYDSDMGLGVGMTLTY
jgi:hypothetical protein